MVELCRDRTDFAGLRELVTIRQHELDLRKLLTFYLFGHQFEVAFLGDVAAPDDPRRYPAPGTRRGTAAVLVARFTPPRPSRDRIRASTGIGCVGRVLVLTAEALAQAATLLYFEAANGSLGATWQTSGFAKWIHMHVLLPACHPISVAVIAAWAILFLSGRGSPEASWIDRTGRALGICWIAAVFLFWFNRYFLDGRLPFRNKLSHRLHKSAFSQGFGLWISDCCIRSGLPANSYVHGVCLLRGLIRPD